MRIYWGWRIFFSPMVSGMLKSMQTMKTDSIFQAGSLLLLFLTTAITGEQHGAYIEGLYRILKILAYSTILLLIIARILAHRKNLADFVRQGWTSFHPVFRVFGLLYFLGQRTGALRGPAPLASLWQTASDGLVFALAFLYFGWPESDPAALVRRLFRALAVGLPILLLGSLVFYIQRYPDLAWLIPFSGVTTPLLSLPFNYPNHYAYILMAGVLAAGFLFLDGSTSRRRIWLLPAGFLFYGLYLTGARGALLGTAVGLLGFLLLRHRRLGLAAAALLLLGTAMLLWLFRMGDIQHRTQSDLTVIDLSTFEVLPADPDPQAQTSARDELNRPVLSPAVALRTMPFDLPDGNIRFLLYAITIPYQQDGAALQDALPEMEITVLSDGVPAAEAAVRLTPGKKYAVSTPLSLAGSSPVQLQLALKDPGIPVDLRPYVHIFHLTMETGNTPAVTYRILNMLPKTTLSFRLEVWQAGLRNLKKYGPLGVGAGNAQSLEGLGMHNMYMEQYGEGGLAGLLGFLGWLILPVLTLKKSRLDRNLAWGVVAMMAALLVHGIFWDQFLNGLRFLTLVYVCLWTALASRRVEQQVSG